MEGFRLLGSFDRELASLMLCGQGADGGGGEWNCAAGVGVWSLAGRGVVSAGV